MKELINSWNIWHQLNIYWWRHHRKIVSLWKKYISSWQQEVCSPNLDNTESLSDHEVYLTEYNEAIIARPCGSEKMLIICDKKMVLFESHCWRKIMGLEKRYNLERANPVFIYFVQLASVKQLLYLRLISPICVT